MNALAGRGCDEVVEGGGGLSIVVAKQRFCGISDCRESRMAVDRQRRAEGLRAAILERRAGGERRCSGVEYLQAVESMRSQKPAYSLMFGPSVA